MRLIDADALDNMLADAQTECKRNGGNFRFGVLSAVWENIKTIPAIDAIPVQWLHKKREQMIDAAQNTPEQAIAYVLWLWKKEGT